MYPQVDQVVIDVEAGVIDFRVAKTMGTAIEVNWLFTNRPGEEFYIKERGGVITAAGMTGIGSYSFSMSAGVLLFGTTYVGHTMAFGWECSP